jgi:hypothetical protein
MGVKLRKLGIQNYRWIAAADDQPFPLEVSNGMNALSGLANFGKSDS